MAVVSDCSRERWQSTARTVDSADRERRTASVASRRREGKKRPVLDRIRVPVPRVCTSILDYSRLCVFLRRVVDGRARRVSLGFGRRLQSSRRRVFEPGLRRATSRRDGARTGEPRVSIFSPPRHVAHVVSASPRHVPRSVQSSTHRCASLALASFAARCFAT